MKEGGILIMNTRKSPEAVETSKGSSIRIATVDAEQDSHRGSSAEPS
ncbi:MAG: hypothetical protein MZU91_03170 [Desulfosudis oleivorans]|nr:hypothetical protein [Desulfosudis oleivorans]